MPEETPKGAQEMTAAELAALVGTAVNESLLTMTNRTDDVATLLE